LNHEGHEGHEDKIKKKQVINVFSYLFLRALRVLRGKIRITGIACRASDFLHDTGFLWYNHTLK